MQNPPNPSKTVPEGLSPLNAPQARPPVDLFRTLLVMTPIERRDFLTNRPPEVQKSILAKVHEYETLPPEQRLLRLRVTELRWYLLPLLSTPATNRVAQLRVIPSDEVRSLVEDRLSQWDKLSSDVQKRVLDNESTLRFQFELAGIRPDQRAKAVADIPEAARAQFEAGIQRWRALPLEQRQEIVKHFGEFFGLTRTEQEKTLRNLSPAERLQIEKTLQTFEGLTPDQRARCLRAFQKFVSFTPEERLQFLKSAEQWKVMTPTERESWRNLVSSLSHGPPLPPGLVAPPVPAPPVRASASSGASTLVVTNTN